MDNDFIFRPVAKDKVYDYWLNRVDVIEALTVNSKPADTLDIGYLLFPLIDSISYTLFGSSARKYLKELKISHPDLVYTMFRNGLLHNMSSYKLEYSDGEVYAALMSSGGTGGFRQFNPGSTSDDFPAFNIPPEKVFEYVDAKDGTMHAMLQLDRLAALVRHDLIIRKS
jgi:hypothetical protein